MATERSRLDLDVNLTGNAASGLKAAAQSANDLWSNLDKAGKAGSGVDRSAFGFERKGKGGDESDPKAFGKAMGALALTVMGIGKAFQFFGQSLAIGQNAAMTNAQKMEAFGQSIPILGTFVKGWTDFRDAVSGTTEALRRQAAAYEDNTKKQEILFAAERQYDSLRREKEAARAAHVSAGEIDASGRLRGGLGNGGYSAPELTGKSGYAQEQKYREYERMAPFREKELNLARSIGAEEIKTALIQKDSAGLRKNNLSLVEDERQMRQDLGRAMRLENSYIEMKAEKDRLIKGLLANQQAQINNMTQLEENAVKAKESGLAKLRMEAELRANNVAQQREELAILKEKEDRARGQLEAWGMLTKGERIFAQQAANQAKTQGFGTLAESQKAILAKAGAGDFLAQEARRNAQADPDRKRFAAAIGETMADDFDKIRKQRVELNANIEANVQINEELLAEELATKLGPLIKAIEVAITNRVNRQLSKVDIERRAKNANGGG